MGSPKIRMPKPPPPPADYADQAAKEANRVNGSGSRRRSFISGGSSGASTVPVAAKQLLGQ